MARLGSSVDGASTEVSATATVAWDEERELELRVTLATLTRFSDYRVDVEWDAEVDGANNPLWTGAGYIPGVEEDSDEWHKHAQVRYWWQAIREESALTVEAAASQIGFNKSTLARWESGERTPDASSRPRYAHWLEEKKAELVDHYKNRAIDLVTQRDGWPQPPTGVERDVLLEEFSRIGGWWDQWRRTGSIPNTRR